MHLFLPQQIPGHQVFRPRRNGSRSVCRALVLLALAAGCGEVHFVPSPYTPQAIELIYSSQEHITVMRWRVSATPPLKETRFELLGTNGYQPIDFSQSVYPGGLIACGDGFGTCVQYVVRGQYAADSGTHPIQAVHDVYGVLPGGVPTIKTVSPTLELQSFFHTNNDIVYLNITDKIGSDSIYKFKRSYERTMWASAGLCLSETPPDGVSFSALDATGGFPPETPLTTAGTYCVAARAVPSDGGDATMVQVRIATLPELVSGTQTYEPPIERSPVVYQIILDLEIPVPDRCADVIDKIETWTARYLVGGGVPVRKLPTINLAQNPSSDCAQTNNRVVASADMADKIKQMITTLTGEHQQIHLMYFNNLDAPLPAPLVTSLQSLFDGLAQPPAGYQLQTISWLFNPGTGYASPIQWWFYWPWETDDPMFAVMLADYGLKTLPYTTQFHDPFEPVPLLSAEQTVAYETHLVKICTSSNLIQPLGVVPFQHFISTPSWEITSADPPAYLVMLNNQVAVASGQFVEQSVIVNYQICTRYCEGHGFVDTTGRNGADDWANSYYCAKDN